tara:strand:+ start:1261 stop:2220 length:960 start_codon:yes stop_codon:yes gene_type:complete
MKIKLFLLTLYFVNIFVSTHLASQEDIPLPATINIPQPIGDDCIKSPKEGLTTYKCEGLKFALHVPKVCLQRSCGLIVDVHGWMMTGELQDKNTDISKIAGQAGFIVINPTANKTVFGRSWDHKGKQDQQVFQFMKRVQSIFHIMKERIHFTGFSQGANMAWRFVCKYSKDLSSVAPLSFGAGDPIGYQSPVFIKPYKDCFGENQIDILYAHGKTDALVDYSGALATLKTLGESWEMNNVETISEDAGYKRLRFTNQNNTIFEFISYEWETQNQGYLSSTRLKGHCFPGVDGYLGCGKDNSFHWGKEVVKFFLEHPKKL